MCVANVCSWERGRERKDKIRVLKNVERFTYASPTYIVNRLLVEYRDHDRHRHHDDDVMMASTFLSSFAENVP